MKNDIDEWAVALDSYCPIDRARDLYSQLIVNSNEIENLVKAIEIAQNNNSDPNTLENLFQNEFMLLMDNVGLFEDLMLTLDRVEKTPENEFELARIKRDAKKLVIVEVIEL